MKMHLVFILAAWAIVLGLSPARAADPTPRAVTVVFDLEHSLIQQVPHFNVKLLKASHVIKANGGFYGLSPDAVEVLRRLDRNPRVRIVIASDRSEKETRQLLEAISLDSSGRTLASATDRIIPRGKADAVLKEASQGSDPTVLVTDDSVAELPATHDPNAGLVIRTGPSYFYFDHYAQSVDDANTTKAKHADFYAKNAQNFAPNEAAFHNFQNRMDGVFYRLDDSLRQTQSGQTDFLSALQALQKKPFTEAENLGQTRLRSHLEWKVEKGQVTGCLEKDPDHKGAATELSKEICANELTAKLDWTGPQMTLCGRFTKDGLPIDTIPIEACISRLKVYYLWTERELDRCGAFTKNAVFLADVPKAKCTMNVVCDVHSGVLSSFVKKTANDVVFKVLKSLDDIPPSANPLSSLARKSSFASMLLSPRWGKQIQSQLSAACGAFLTKFFRDGKSLTSSVLEKAAQPERKIPFASGVEDNTFYHHTNADEPVKLLHPEITNRYEANEVTRKDEGYDRILYFLREKPDTHFWFMVFYVAEDPTSSTEFGSHTLEFDFDPNAKVVQSDSALWKSAFDELTKRYPGFSACTSDQQNDNGINFMMADDSGIDLIDYTISAHPTSHSWFQVVNFKSVLRTKVIQ